MDSAQGVHDAPGLHSSQRPGEEGDVEALRRLVQLLGVDEAERDSIGKLGREVSKRKRDRLRVGLHGENRPRRLGVPPGQPTLTAPDLEHALVGEVDQAIERPDLGSLGILDRSQGASEYAQRRILRSMSGLQSKRFDEPDEFQKLPLQTRQVVTLGEVYVSRTVLEPGWSWAEHVKPIVGTPSCQHHHQGVITSGQLEFETDAGARRLFGPGEAFEAAPGHNARVVGDEPVVAIEWAGVRGFGKPAEAGERVVATLLVTDIVESTAIAARLGDAAWKELLGRHGDRVRLELDRFRGFEVTTTGDGFLAIFDGAARAVRCAAAIRLAAELDDLRIRAGVHSGEVERQAGNVRGVAVHAATRIAALAEPGEVLVSAPAAGLLEGSGLSLEDAGEHELRGLSGRRRLYRLAEQGAD
jgi:class 3 adenylate cyclase